MVFSLCKGYHIKRDNDLVWITKNLPSDVTPGKWCLIGNPPGQGKSSLIREWAYRRSETSNTGIPPLSSGPVLLTDFSNAQNLQHAEKKIMNTINPLFFPTFSRDSEGMHATNRLF